MLTSYLVSAFHALDPVHVYWSVSADKLTPLNAVSALIATIPMRGLTNFGGRSFGGGACQELCWTPLHGGRCNDTLLDITGMTFTHDLSDASWFNETAFNASSPWPASHISWSEAVGWKISIHEILPSSAISGIAAKFYLYALKLKLAGWVMISTTYLVIIFFRQWSTTFLRLSVPFISRNRSRRIHLFHFCDAQAFFTISACGDVRCLIAFYTGQCTHGSKDSYKPQFPIRTPLVDTTFEALHLVELLLLSALPIWATSMTGFVTSEEQEAAFSERWPFGMYALAICLILAVRISLVLYAEARQFVRAPLRLSRYSLNSPRSGSSRVEFPDDFADGDQWTDAESEWPDISTLGDTQPPTDNYSDEEAIVTARYIRRMLIGQFAIAVLGFGICAIEQLPPWLGPALSLGMIVASADIKKPGLWKYCNCVLYITELLLQCLFNWCVGPIYRRVCCVPRTEYASTEEVGKRIIKAMPFDHRRHLLFRNTLFGALCVITVMSVDIKASEPYWYQYGLHGPSQPACIDRRDCWWSGLGFQAPNIWAYMGTFMFATAAWSQVHMMYRFIEKYPSNPFASLLLYMGGAFLLLVPCTAKMHECYFYIQPEWDNVNGTGASVVLHSTCAFITLLQMLAWLIIRKEQGNPDGAVPLLTLKDSELIMKSCLAYFSLSLLGIAISFSQAWPFSLVVVYVMPFVTPTVEALIRCRDSRRAKRDLATTVGDDTDDDLHPV